MVDRLDTARHRRGSFDPHRNQLGRHAISGHRPSTAHWSACQSTIAAWLTEPFASLAFAGVPHGSKWFALWPLLGALMALFAALCAFRIRSRALMGLAIAGALLHIAHFYYLLGTTLLIKSCLMILVGAALLMASMRLQRKPQ